MPPVLRDSSRFAAGGRHVHHHTRKIATGGRSLNYLASSRRACAALLYFRPGGGSLAVSTSASSRGEPTSVGRLIQHWRRARKQSQLAVALRAGVSARHLGFVEVGRAQPSRE